VTEAVAWLKANPRLSRSDVGQARTSLQQSGAAPSLSIEQDYHLRVKSLICLAIRLINGLPLTVKATAMAALIVANFTFD
jgi:hypothetical protein